MTETNWLLEGDPAIRWQVLRDLENASPDSVAAERARVEHDGWGARLLAVEDPDGLWAGGACFPASYRGGEQGQPWTATAERVPAFVRGSVVGSGAAGAAVAVAVNGHVAAVVPTNPGSDGVRFSALLPENAFRRGANDVRAIVIR